MFVHHNRLAERFARVKDGGHFAIAETGFGNGLGFLASWRLWQQSNRHPHACLHFISVERDPLPRDELARALALWPNFSSLAAELVSSYPSIIEAPHRLVLDGGRVRLTLCFGDIRHVWKDLDFFADAWFLDDLAPEINVNVWNEEAIGMVASHSGPGTSVTALSADTQTEELLSEAGFQMSRASESAIEAGVLTGEIPSLTPAGEDYSTQTESVGIVGAGIAGSLMAANLASRGFRVTLVDSASSIASGASGNRQGALYVKLGVDYNDQTRLALSSLLFSQRFYRHFEGNGWHPTGLLQLAYNDTEADRQARFLAKNSYPREVLEAVSADQSSQIAGIPIHYKGLWFPKSGWLQPLKICEKLSSQPGIKRTLGFSVATLQKENARWVLMSCKNETLTFDRVVLCAGPETARLIPLDNQYRMKRIRGQITEVPGEYLDAPAVVVCGPGYINPCSGGSSLVGATFDLHDSCPEVTTQSDHENLQMLAGLLPEALDPSSFSKIATQSRGRVAFRCTTHDYQPVAGPVKQRDSRPLQGLYMLTGLGSKGLTYCPLLAEYLGDIISGQPQCLPGSLAKRVETRRVIAENRLSADN